TFILHRRLLHRILPTSINDIRTYRQCLALVCDTQTKRFIGRPVLQASKTNWRCHSHALNLKRKCPRSRITETPVSWQPRIGCSTRISEIAPKQRILLVGGCGESMWGRLRIAHSTAGGQSCTRMYLRSCGSKLCPNCLGENATLASFLRAQSMTSIS